MKYREVEIIVSMIIIINDFRTHMGKYEEQSGAGKYSCSVTKWDEIERCQSIWQGTIV